MKNYKNILFWIVFISQFILTIYLIIDIQDLLYRIVLILAAFFDIVYIKTILLKK